MKLTATFVAVMIVMSAVVTSQLVPLNPDQNRCKHLRALPYSDKLFDQLLADYNYVGMVSVMQNPPSELKPKSNNCAVFSYTNDCRGIMMQVNQIDHSSKTVLQISQYAKNSDSQVVTTYEENFELVDEKYAVFRNRLQSMTYQQMDPTRTTTNVNPIPTAVRHAHDELIAVIDAHEKHAWIAFQTCGRGVVWVLYAFWVVQQQAADQFVEEIYQRLEKLGIPRNSILLVHDLFIDF